MIPVKSLMVLTISGALLLAGCDQKIGGDAAPTASTGAQSALMGAPGGNVVAVVNGEVISEPLLDVFAKGRGLDISDPAQRMKALETLEETLLLAQEAIHSGLASKPEVQAEVTLARLLQLSGRMVSSYRQNIEVPEQAIRDYYDQEAARVGTQEFHLQHILFKDEDEALEAAGKGIQADADFSALMGEYAAKGAGARDLGWVNRTQVPATLAESAGNLADGQVAPVPIRSEFGWHVLKRVGARPFTPPPFEQVRDGAEQQLKARALADQVKALRAKASIQAPQAGSPNSSESSQAGG